MLMIYTPRFAGPLIGAAAAAPLAPEVWRGGRADGGRGRGPQARRPRGLHRARRRRPEPQGANEIISKIPLLSHTYGI